MERTPQGPQHRKRASVVLRSLISARNSKTAGAEQLVPSNLPENASNDFLEAKLAPAWASPIPPRDQQTTKSPKKHINQPSPMLTIEADKNNGERRPRHLKTLSTSAIQTTLGLGDKALRPSKADNMRPGPTPTLNRHRVQRSLGTLSDMMSPKAHSQAASGEKRPRDKENVCPTAGPQDTFDVPIYRQFCSQNTLSSGPGPSPVARGKDVEVCGSVRLRITTLTRLVGREAGGTVFATRDRKCL